MLRLDHVLYGVQPRETRAMAHVPADWQAKGFGEAVIDSREAAPDSLFVALTGERTDGHNFLADVIARGARGALVSRAAVAARQDHLAHVTRPWRLIEPTRAEGLADAPPDTCILIAVDDPLMALQRLAVYHRRQLTPTVVGITGSVGKTSTKEVVAAVLHQRLSTLKSKRSFNSEATLPTTLLSLTPAHAAAVLEMGMWAPGEIRFLASLARPHIGVVTNVGPSHMERLGSIEAIAAAKAELPESLPPEGWCVLNADDPRVAAMAACTPARVFTFGQRPDADLWLAEVRSRGLEGLRLTVRHGAQMRSLSTPLIGRHHAATALAAISVGLLLGLSWEEIGDGLRDPSAQARLRVLPGLHGSTLIDDSYNAAPASTMAALAVLAEAGGRRIAVLGDMLELGAAEEPGHREVGRAVPSAADLLLAVGSRARWIADEARAAGMPAAQVSVYRRSQDALGDLQTTIQPNDTVLIKASRGVELDYIVAALHQRPIEEK